MITKQEIEKALEERHSSGMHLARIGVGHLHLIDFDRVDITNLNRQQYFYQPDRNVQNGRHKRKSAEDQSLS